MITGESGTGKELFARAIHENSVRGHKNFVVVDYAALPENLVETVLYEHKKGAFTAAEPGTSILYPQHLSERIRIKIARSTLGKNPQVQEEKSFKPTAGTFPTLKESRKYAVAQAEKRYLQELMQAVDGNIHEVCEIAGLRRARFYELLKKYSISRQDC